MNIVRKLVAVALLSVPIMPSYAQRERINFDEQWHFAYGNAADPVADFGRGTEYFNYLTKANSIHNIGPYSPDFKEDPDVWRIVDLPHDFAVDLAFSQEASYSHGSKTVGWKYPASSVGWYRKSFKLPESDRDKHVRLQFDGIFREGEVWVNGIYLGRRSSGYIAHDYDITPYLFFGDKPNHVCVRADASLEEGWFYEGAGIYRHSWIVKCGKLHVSTDGIFVRPQLNEDYSRADITIESDVVNDSGNRVESYGIRYDIFGPDGIAVASYTADYGALEPRAGRHASYSLALEHPSLWDIESPNLYSVVATVIADGVETDRYSVKTGIRDIRMDCNEGFFLNGRHVQLRGFNIHQDHAGVGAGMPDGLQKYRLSRLKWMGANAYRSSHNPMTPELLDACDEMGILVLEENRLLGINPYQMEVAEDMIRKGRNHPCIFAWSIANEEWGLEWDDRSIEIARTMVQKFHLMDPTRPVAVASSSGPHILLGADIAGYNYIKQHSIDELRIEYPQRLAIGSEETTGCGTRGIYFNECPQLFGGEDENSALAAANPSGRMPARNRIADTDGSMDRIERGLKFYDMRPWLMGLFFWTGFDYRGEPSPLGFPATGSMFGVLDYCGFAKDEAYFLKSWWRPEEPVIHILPHWNLAGHEGEEIDVWVYGNCDEVELKVNGRSIGRKPMPYLGHLSWRVKYRPGKVEAIGYNNGRKVVRERHETSGAAVAASMETSSFGDIHVVDITMRDSAGRFVPDACCDLAVELSGDGKILGWGNGDSAFNGVERPVPLTISQAAAGICNSSSASFSTFNGCAQLIICSSTGEYELKMNIGRE